MPGQESDFHHFERRRLLSTFVSLSTISEEAFSTVQQKWGKVIINLETLIRMKFVVSPLNEANYLITICAAGPPSDSISVSKSDFVARREGGWFRLYEVMISNFSGIIGRFAILLVSFMDGATGIGARRRGKSPSTGKILISDFTD
jgi:hypothetical protein